MVAGSAVLSLCSLSIPHILPSLCRSSWLLTTDTTSFDVKKIITSKNLTKSFHLIFRFSGLHVLTLGQVCRIPSRSSRYCPVSLLGRPMRCITLNHNPLPSLTNCQTTTNNPLGVAHSLVSSGHQAHRVSDHPLHLQGMPSIRTEACHTPMRITLTLSLDTHLCNTTSTRTPYRTILPRRMDIQCTHSMSVRGLRVAQRVRS